jgi:WD40 repeat protein
MKRILFVSITLFLIFCVQFLSHAQVAGFVPISSTNIDEVVPLASVTVEDTFGYGTDAYFSPDDQWLIVPAQHNGRAINLETYSQRFTPAYARKFIPNTHEVFLESGSDRLSTFNYATGIQRVWNVDISVGNAAYIVSPNGEYVVTLGYFDEIIRLWRVSDGTQIRILERLGAFRSVAFSPDGLYLAWTVQDNRINILDLETNEVIQEVETAAGTLQYINDSSHLLICKDNMELWDLSQAIVVAQAAGHSQCTITPDSAHLVTYDAPSSVAGSAKVYLLNNHEFFLLLSVDRSEYTDMVLSNHADWLLALAAIQSPSTLYDVHTGRIIHVFETGIRSAQFSLDDNLLFTATFEQVDIWQVATTGLTHVRTLSGGGFNLSPENTALAVNMDEVTVIYGIPTETRPTMPFVVPADIVPSAIQVRANPDPNAEVIGSAMGRIYVGGYENNYLYVPDSGGWIRSESSYVALAYGFSPALFQDTLPEPTIEIPTPTSVPPIQTSTPVPTATPYVESIALIPQNEGITDNSIIPENTNTVRLLGSAAFDTYVGVFTGDRPILNHDANKLIVLLNYYGRSEYAQIIDLETDSSYVLTAPNGEAVYQHLISPDGSKIAYVQDSSIYVYDIEHETTQFVAGTPGQINTGWRPLGFSADGSRLAVQAYRTNIQIYDLETLTVDLELPIQAVSLMFSPSDRKIAVRVQDREVFHILDTQNGEILNYVGYTIENYSYSSLTSVEFSPDERFLAFVIGDKLHLYDLNTDEFTLQSNMTKFAFTPDSQFIVLMLEAGLHFYETETGNLASVYEASSTATSFAISPNAQLIATGNPLQFVDIQSRDLTAITPFRYAALNMSFTPDGRFLWAYDSLGVMIFGIPTSENPEWQPITARIVPSSINLREHPDSEATVVGQVSGTVLIAGTNLARNAVYLPEHRGWIWGDSAYLDTNGIPLRALPIISGEHD